MSGDHRLIGDNRHDTDLGEPMTLRREPATLWLGLVAPIVQALAAFVFAASPDVQGAVNAAAVAVAGAITAFLVSSDNLLPAITGAIQAVIALILAFGIHWDSGQQAALMVALGAVAAFVVRDRVTAPVSAPTVVSA
jgi:hypothetical protein